MICMRKEQDWKKKGGRLTVRDAGGVGVSIDLGCGDRPPMDRGISICFGGRQPMADSGGGAPSD